MNISATGWISRLREFPEIPDDAPAVKGLPIWTYMPADAPPLIELRSRYGLAGMVSGLAELPAVLHLLDWAYRVMEHDGGMAIPKPWNALSILDACVREKRSVNCRLKAIVLNEAYLSLGIRSRYITCMPAVADGDCHVVVMIYMVSLKRWITVDPTHNTYFTGRDGAIISVVQARQVYRAGETPGMRHIERPLTAPLVCNGVECASYDEFYLLYMAKNCFRFACPLSSEFDYESRGDARFIYLSPPGYDPAVGAEYDPQRCSSTHHSGDFLRQPDGTALLGTDRE